MDKDGSGVSYRDDDGSVSDDRNDGCVVDDGCVDEGRMSDDRDYGGGVEQGGVSDDGYHRSVDQRGSHYGVSVHHRGPDDACGRGVCDGHDGHNNAGRRHSHEGGQDNLRTHNQLLAHNPNNTILHNLLV